MTLAIISAFCGVVILFYCVVHWNQLREEAQQSEPMKVHIRGIILSGALFVIISFMMFIEKCST